MALPSFEAQPVLQPINVLVIVADDLGKERVSAFGANAYQPPMPGLAALAASGVKFTNFWTMPACSHTRAAAMTGRYGFRTKITGVIDSDVEVPLPLNELIIPKLLAMASPGQIDTGLIGKWHLSNPINGSWMAPNAFGFDTFKGSKGNIRNDGGTGYFSWKRGVNGRVATSSTYNTTQLTDDAIAWINAHGTGSNWLGWLAYAAPHNPFDRPPAGLYSNAAYSALRPDLAYPLPSAVAPTGDEPAYLNAMAQALDTEIVRLMAGIDPAILSNTVVVFFSDNGTTSSGVFPGHLTSHSKGSAYEDAINGPLIVSGATVSTPNRTSTKLVSVVDIFSTILAIFGVNQNLVIPHGRTVDGISFKPILDAPSGDNGRAYLFSEQFASNARYPVFGETSQASVRAIRDAQYKLMLETNTAGDRKPDQMFDLTNDPGELTNLLTSELSGGEAAAYVSLSSQLEALLATV